MYNYLLEIMIFVFGMCIGSFMNVCIYRLPALKSIVHPRSMCLNCGNPIRFYDNIPLISYLLLKGRCRDCNTHISVRYPLVEIISGFFALCVFIKFGFKLEGAIYFILIASLLVITFIDIDHQIIPDVISLPGIPIGFAASFFLPEITWADSITGILAGGGSLLFVAWAYTMIAKKEGMGGGDIKLLAMIGGFIGLRGVLFTIFTASAVGALTGVIVMLRTHKGLKLAVPFGPFLSIGAIVHIFFGDKLISWYLNLPIY